MGYPYNSGRPLGIMKKCRPIKHQHYSSRTKDRLALQEIIFVTTNHRYRWMSFIAVEFRFQSLVAISGQLRSSIVSFEVICHHWFRHFTTKDCLPSALISCWLMIYFPRQATKMCCVLARMKMTANNSSPFIQRDKWFSPISIRSQLCERIRRNIVCDLLIRRHSRG